MTLWFEGLCLSWHLRGFLCLSCLQSFSPICPFSYYVTTAPAAQCCLHVKHHREWNLSLQHFFLGRSASTVIMCYYWLWWSISMVFFLVILVLFVPFYLFIFWSSYYFFLLRVLVVAKINRDGPTDSLLTIYHRQQSNTSSIRVQICKRANLDSAFLSSSQWTQIRRPRFRYRTIGVAALAQKRVKLQGTSTTHGSTTSQSLPHRERISRRT